MNDTLIERIQADAAALDIKITAQEIALYLSDKKVPPEHLEAIKRFIAFLRKNQRDKAISALLQHSRIPQKEPSTFDDFSADKKSSESDSAILKTEYSFYRSSGCWKNAFINGIW